MTAADIALITLIILLFACAVRYIIKTGKQGGCAGCCGNCAECAKNKHNNDSKA